MSVAIRCLSTKTNTYAYEFNPQIRFATRRGNSCRVLHHCRWAVLRDASRGHGRDSHQDRAARWRWVATVAPVKCRFQRELRFAEPQQEIDGPQSEGSW